ncbi:hypothetical protein CRG98_026746 [Punica granatum]|uniref:Uncharacterized protein n=2 Tax=Punica granatum TaxID=22663 RepID=A0A2I0J9I3_PUNGR|nr:hypothetical protein CRG98_026746 [Punica granatum]
MSSTIENSKIDRTTGMIGILSCAPGASDDLRNHAAIDSAQSWSQMFFGGVKSSRLQYHEPELAKGRRLVKPPKSVFDERAKSWKNALVGQLIAIYAANTANERVHLWNSLRHIKSVVGCLPWIVAGHFNVVRDANEASNGDTSELPGIEDFKALIEDTNLQDQPSIGSFGTWTDIRSDGFIARKLDRMMAEELMTLKPYQKKLWIFMKNSWVLKDPLVTGGEVSTLQDILHFRFSDEQRLRLSQPVNMEEIKEALWSMYGDRAPRPNGYSAHFFKASWDTVGKEFTHAIMNFFL